MADKSIKFMILDQNFVTVAALNHFHSIMWIDRYNKPGEFELIMPPNDMIKKYLVRDNYVWSKDSDKLMIIEEVKVETSYEDGPKFTIKGRSLESVLDRRILLYDTVFKENLEDDLRQILDVSLMSHAASGRVISNFIFEYTHDERISNFTTDMEFKKGDNLLDVIQEICKGHKLGYQITLNSSDQMVFKVIVGEDRTYEQTKNPYVIFSPKFCNLVTSSFNENGGADYRNVVYTVGEQVDDRTPPQEIISGTTTGLARREIFNDASSISHEVDDVTLTDAEYTKQLQQSAQEVMDSHIVKTESDCEVDYKVNFEYGKDYYIGDIVQVENEYGYTKKCRVTEFIIHHYDGGVEYYPTFTGLEEEDET